MPPVFGSRPDGTPSCMTLSAPFAPFLLLLLVRVLLLALPCSLLALVAPLFNPLLLPPCFHACVVLLSIVTKGWLAFSGACLFDIISG